ncbi:GH92 family glycosyl hydrolase [Rufibacter sp. LB8]|uniref:GH92 family glycosyl hydrolase n=1 Tax=Rufibacter sp. LB8 TaxID=2777781 RepID=UPI00178C6E75|nr:GH92 family glycosyl hydrolase [Rufibacter sp. LB8]
MRKLLLLAFLFCQLSAFAQKPLFDLVRWVNPLIGTHKMGHTYPGATVPFGMVQLSPDTDTIPYEVNGKYNKDVYKYCAGYQYSDPTIVGFSHTHFSGTGHSDLGDFLLMPTTGKLQLNPGTENNPETGYRSKFSHDNERAEPAYYRVKLDDHNITAELTATNRVGMHQYTFPKSDEAHVILDLMHGIYNYEDKNVWTFIRIENDTLITGYRQTNGWARTRTVYFAMAFSKPFISYGNKDYSKAQVYKGFWRKFDQSKNFPEMAGKQIRAYFDFKTEEGEKIKIKFALSPVSTQGALANLRAEVPHWDFDRVKNESQALWNKELGKVRAALTTKDDYINFYTALYHTFLGPTTYQDVTGQYRGLDQNNHQANGFTNYTTFSLWDTYRALHPWFNVVQPKRNSDMVESMLAHYDQSVHNMLPVWSHHANENWCMIGYHSVSVIADAILKGTYTGDANRALDACVTTARQGYYDGLQYYMQLGYVPEDKNSSSVSKTLEYAYDDWCIAQIAQKLDRQDIYQEFSRRAQNWKNVYDKSIGFMRPKLSDGTFKKEFDVLSTHNQGFIEGNAWNYSLYVPHDPAAMIQAMGGNKRFVPHLDSLFTMHLPDEFFADTEDITREGIIGNYVHGNEPAHHAAYLYNWTNQPWKTQERVRMILKKQYQATPDGLGGNDDCGQMSAWYLFSSLGFYPVAPGAEQYALGSPAVLEATINLENGKTFTIEAKNQSAKNVFVKKVELNGKVLAQPFLNHADIAKGGKLVFYMTGKPKK